MDEQGRRLAVAFEQAESPGSRGVRRRRRRGFALATAGGLGVVIVAAFAILGRSSGEGGGGILTVEQAVAAVTRAAFAQPGTEPDKYTYQKSRNSSLTGGRTRGVGAYSRIVTITTEHWTRKGEEKGWLRVSHGADAFPSEADRLAFEKINRSVEKYAKEHHQKAYTPPDNEGTFVCHTIVAGFQSPATPGAVLQLKNDSAIPTTARSVYRRLLKAIPAQTVASTEEKYSHVWGSIGWAMEGGAPKQTPQQRAAFVGALALIPGVRTLGRTTDPNGNDTIGFVRDAGARRDVLFFDANTSQTTFVAQTLTRPEKVAFTRVPAGTTIWSHELLDYRHLDELPPLKQSKVKKNSMAWMQCPELRPTKSKKRDR